MKENLKLTLLLFAAVILGVGASLLQFKIDESVGFYGFLLSGVMVLPLLVALIFKNLKSKWSGYFFMVGALLFGFLMGYSLMQP